MKQIPAAALLCIMMLFTACETDKRPEQSNESEPAEGRPNIELYLTSRETTDPTLCKKDGWIQTDCGIEDIYFTLKGNVILRAHCKGESEAAWVIGKYRNGDSGIVCQMDKVYIVSLVRTGDSVNYNRGQYLDLNNKDPFALERTSCKEAPYIKRYSDKQRASTEAQKKPQVFGRVYYEQADHAQKMLEEIRKVKALSEL